MFIEPFTSDITETPTKTSHYYANTPTKKKSKVNPYFNVKQTLSTLYTQKKK